MLKKKFKIHFMKNVKIPTGLRDEPEGLAGLGDGKEVIRLGQVKVLSTFCHFNFKLANGIFNVSFFEISTLNHFKFGQISNVYWMTTNFLFYYFLNYFAEVCFAVLSYLYLNLPAFEFWIRKKSDFHLQIPLYNLNVFKILPCKLYF